MANQPNYSQASDTLLHAKDPDGTERIIFPITRYNDVMHAPKVTSDLNSSHDAPFLLLKENSVEIDEEELHELCNSLI